MTKPTNQVQTFTNFTSHSNNFALTKLHKLHPKPPLNLPSNKLQLKTFCSQAKIPPPSQTSPLISILRVIPDWVDDVKERGMRKKRALYNHEKWVEHRSSLRHLRHLVSCLTSRVIYSLIPPVIAFTAWAVAVASYNSSVSMHWLPEFLPVMRTSSLPYQLTAPALALLLVFRTEASYSRYEEGRKAWTKVISGSNDLARQVIAGVDDSNNRPLKNALLQYIMAFPVALKCHVIYGSDARHDLQNLVDRDDLDVILNSEHRPNCIIDFMTQTLQLLNLEESRRMMLQSKILCFHDGIGVCDQLMGIPIPLSYTRLTSRFLFFWHFTLPIILWDDCHWIVVPATIISAAALFCIEEVGVLIEEPFPMLALDELCIVLHRSICGAIGKQKLIKAQLSAKRGTYCTEHSANGRPTS